MSNMVKDYNRGSAIWNHSAATRKDDCCEDCSRPEDTWGNKNNNKSTVEALPPWIV